MSTGRKAIMDKLELRLVAKGRVIDGVWVGASDNDDPKARERVEAAFALIKNADIIQYKRILRHLKRIWIRIVTSSARACYRPSIDACALDERYVLSPDTSIEMIASSIVHEATHARLDHWAFAMMKISGLPSNRFA
jgi:hypothetical protein